MNTNEFISLCQEAIRNWFNEHKDKTDNFELQKKDIYVVWNCKTLQNNKALLSTNVPDGMYYECTYNGDKHELYLDTYKKFDNQKIEIG